MDTDLKDDVKNNVLHCASYERLLLKNCEGQLPAWLAQFSQNVCAMYVGLYVKKNERGPILLKSQQGLKV